VGASGVYISGAFGVTGVEKGEQKEDLFLSWSSIIERKIGKKPIEGSTWSPTTGGKGCSSYSYVCSGATGCKNYAYSRGPFAEQKAGAIPLITNHGYSFLIHLIMKGNAAWRRKKNGERENHSYGGNAGKNGIRSTSQASKIPTHVLNSDLLRHHSAKR